jgi:hypothetical protein
MGTMPPKDLLALWARDNMPVEMAVGHILQNLTTLQATVEANHLQVHQLQSVLESLIGRDKALHRATRNNRSHNG